MTSILLKVLNLLSWRDISSVREKASHALENSVHSVLFNEVFYGCLSLNDSKQSTCS